MSRSVPFDDLPSSAVSYLAEELGVEEPTIISATETRLPTGEHARVITAVDPKKPNSPSHVTVTEAGVVRSLAALKRTIGRERIFVAGLPVVRDSPTPRGPVTVHPMSSDWRLNRCERLSETVAVTVPLSGATPKADVYLLADTTGSMGITLDEVIAGTTAILNNPALASFDIAWGVGNYRDFPTDGITNSYAFAHQLSPTASAPAAAAEISTWVSNEGGDTPEGQFYALHQIATDPAIGWRSDSKRIVVWFGDAPGHDPIPTALSGLVSDITEASVTGELVAAEITVVAVGTTTGSELSLDDDPTIDAFDYPNPPGGSLGQASRISTTTGGSHTKGVDPTQIVGTLTTLIADAVTSTGSISLVPTGATTPFVESITPPSVGPLAGDEEHSLAFEVTWVGVKECTDRNQEFTGTLDVVADGVVVAQVATMITVPACRYHYSVEFISGDVRASRTTPEGFAPGSYATAVTIYNPGTCDVDIEKRFALLAIDEDVVGREPEVSPAKPFAHVVLRAGEAMFDDRVALGEFIEASHSLFFGVLDIVSDRPLSITAAHTVQFESGTSITSRTIEAHLAP